MSGSDVTVSGGAAGAADGNNEVGGAVGEGVIGRPNRDGEDDGYGGGEYSGGMYVEGGVPNCGINGCGEDDIGSEDGAAGAGITKVPLAAGLFAAGFASVLCASA